MSTFVDTFDDWLLADTDLTYDEWLHAGLRSRAKQCSVSWCRRDRAAGIYCERHLPKRTPPNPNRPVYL